MKLLFFGDVMFGRQGNFFVKNPWIYVEPYFQKADAIFFNLETVISPVDIPEKQRIPKTFNYQSNGTQLKILRKIFDKKKSIFVSMINNHTLDYNNKGFLATKRFLKKEKFLTSWTKTPVCGKDKNIYFFSATDHPEDWNKKIWVIDIEQQSEMVLRALVNKIENIRKANPKAFIIFSIHWGPNYLTKIPFYMKKFGRRLIDVGVDIVFGHSAHHIPPPKNYEKYEHGIIIYGLGDFVNDYAVDKFFRSDQALMCLVDTDTMKMNFIPVTRVFVDAHSSIPNPHNY